MTNLLILNWEITTARLVHWGSKLSMNAKGFRKSYRENGWLCASQIWLQAPSILQYLIYNLLGLLPRFIPAQTGLTFETLDSGEYLDLPLQMTIPESLGPEKSGIIDIIKVFSTVEPTSFLWLQFPGLGHQERDNGSAQPLNPPEELEAAITIQYPRRLAHITWWNGRRSRLWFVQGETICSSKWYSFDLAQ